MVVALMAATGWRGSFIVLGIVSCVWVVFWFLLFRDNPADHPRITETELAELPAIQDTSTRLRNRVPWQPLILRMLPVTFVYFCYGWTLWLYLSWLPQYFKNQYSLELKDSALFSAAVFFAGVIGDALGGILSDHILRTTRDLQLGPPQSRSDLLSLFVGLHDSSVPDYEFNHAGCLPGRGIFLRRNDHRTDVGNTDGHCAALCRLC